MLVIKVVPRKDSKGKTKNYLGMQLTVYTDHTKQPNFAKEVENKYAKIQFEDARTPNYFKETYEHLRPEVESAIKEKSFDLEVLEDEYQKLEATLKDFPYREEKLIAKIQEAAKRNDKKTAESFNDMLKYLIEVKSDLNAIKDKMNKLKSSVKHNQDQLRLIDEEIITFSYEPVLRAKYSDFLRSKDETQINLPTSPKEACHVNHEKVLQFMNKNPVKPSDSREKQARNIKAAILAGLDSDTQKMLKKIAIVPKDFFDSKFLEKPEAIEKWINKLARFMKLANKIEKEELKQVELTGARGKEEEQEEHLEEKSLRIKK